MKNKINATTTEAWPEGYSNLLLWHTHFPPIIDRVKVLCITGNFLHMLLLWFPTFDLYLIFIPFFI